MILEPEHDKEEPLAVRSFTPKVEEETGASKTETEAPETTRKSGKRAYPGDILERSL